MFFPVPLIFRVSEQTWSAFSFNLLSRMYVQIRISKRVLLIAAVTINSRDGENEYCGRGILPCRTAPLLATEKLQ